MLLKAIASATLAGLFLTSAEAGTFETIADPICDNSSTTQFWSDGQQYIDSNNGILQESWGLLVRWQGPNFVDNPVSYDIGDFTKLHGAVAQRGVQPEVAYPGGTPGIQISCLDLGMWINTWGNPHRPIVGGGYNDIWARSFNVFKPHPFIENGYVSDLVLQSDIEVQPWFTATHNLFTNPNSPNGSYAITAQVSMFAYLRDTSPGHEGMRPIVIAAMTHMSNADADYLRFGGGPSQDYIATATATAINNWSEWYQNINPNGDGVYFVSAPLNPSYEGFVGQANPHVDPSKPVDPITNPQYLPNYGPFITVGNNPPVGPAQYYTQGTMTSALQQATIPLGTPQNTQFYRVSITPQNMRNTMTAINQNFGVSYSTNPNDWVLEYAGVLAEATLDSENILRATPLPVFDHTTGWPYLGTYNDSTKDQVTLGVHTHAPGIYRYVEED